MQGIIHFYFLYSSITTWLYIFTVGTAEMPRWMKYLTGKYEDQSAGLQNPCESQAGVAEGDMGFLSFLFFVISLCVCCVRDME